MASRGCVAFGGLRFDDAIEEALLTVVDPGAIAAAVAAEKDANQRRDQVREALERDLEAGRYATDRALRQYDAADPANRLVAGELEARWNKALARVAEIAIEWGIVERETVAAVGRQQFQTTEIKFYSDLKSALAEISTDALLCSTSIQYVPDPWSLLDEAIAGGINVIAFDRLPVGSAEHAIFVQRLRENVFSGGSIACRRLSKKNFVAWFKERRFDLVEFFASSETEQSAISALWLLFVRR